jgi:hypothetical protein
MGQFKECGEVADLGDRFADSKEYSFLDSFRAKSHSKDGKPVLVFPHQPMRQRGNAATSGDQLQYHFGGFEQFVPLGTDARGGQEVRADVEPVRGDRRGDQGFSGNLLRERMVRLAEQMRWADAGAPSRSTPRNRPSCPACRNYRPLSGLITSDR